jgi:hypothetical protein
MDLRIGVSMMGLMLAAPMALAKLPALSPDAQAKAEEAKAKAAWTDKVAAYQLCRSMDRVAESYFKTVKASGKPAPAPVATPPCSDPGAYSPPAAPQASAPTLESSGAHSPAATATAPPGSNQTQAEKQGTKK